MKRTSLLAGILLGALTSLPVIAVTLLAAWLVKLPAVPLDIFDWMARTLPGRLVAFGIGSMVTLIRFFHLGPTDTTAKLGEQMMGLLTLVGIGAVFGAVLAVAGDRRSQRLPTFGLVGGLALGLLVIIIEATLGFRSGASNTILWILLLFLLWGAALGWLLQGPQPAEIPATSEQATTVSQTASPALSRRDFIYLGAAGAAAVVVSAIGLENLRKPLALTGGAVPTLDAQSLLSTLSPSATPISGTPAPVSTLGSTPAASLSPAPGTRPNLTANSNFYRIDIDTFPDSIDASTWRFELTGLVNKPLSLTLDEIRSMPSISQPVTMQCISNPLGGDLTSTTIWTGVPLKDVLAEAGLKPGVLGFFMQAQDGFFEYIFLKDAMDPRTMLVYAMNGDPLPVEHGFPLRIYIPNRYGMKQPKWLLSMEALNQTRAGYWVERGWDPEAIAQTTSVIDNVAVDNVDPQNHTIPVGGIAWAGARGISKVEVQVDSGAWVAVNLISPLGPLTWVQWRYDWPVQTGAHTFSVRAYDGTGALQITESNPPEYSGATGIYSVDVTI